MHQRRPPLWKRNINIKERETGQKVREIGSRLIGIIKFWFANGCLICSFVFGIVNLLLRKTQKKNIALLAYLLRSQFKRRILEYANEVQDTLINSNEL